MCQSLQTKEGQEWIPDFLKDTSGTTVTVPGRDKPRPISAADVPLGSGMAQQPNIAIQAQIY